MLIGLTYDLRSDYLAMGYSQEETAEFDSEITVEALTSALQDLGHQVVPIGHIKNLAQRLVNGERWDLVFNICEGLSGIGREAQAPALLDAYGVPYTFSDPLVTALSLHKGMTKTIVRDAGVATPGFAVVHSREEAQAVELAAPLFAKPLAEGTGKGVTAASKVLLKDDLPDVCVRLLERFQQPVLVEEFLPGREFTVGLVGTGLQARIIGTHELFLLPAAEPDVYSYANKQDDDLVRLTLRTRDDPVVLEAEELALRAWRALGCRDAGRIDVRCDAGGRPNFIEVNPLAGLQPGHSDLPLICKSVGMSYGQLIAAIVESASQRVGRPAPIH